MSNPFYYVAILFYLINCQLSFACPA